RKTTPTPASALAPARTLRLEIFPMTFLPPPIFSACRRLVCQPHGGKFLGDHVSGQVGVCARDRGHDGGICDTEIFNSPHATRGVYNRIGIVRRAHPAGATRVECAGDVVADVLG